MSKEFDNWWASYSRLFADDGAIVFHYVKTAFEAGRESAASPPPTYAQGQEDFKESACQIVHEEAWKWVNSGTVGVDICNRLKLAIRALPIKEGK